MKKCPRRHGRARLPELHRPVYSAVGRAQAVEPADYKKQWATVVKNLKKICAYAEKKGKQICMDR